MGSQRVRHDWATKHSTWEMSFPGGSDSKESACNAGGQGSIPGLGRSPGKGNGNPLQYFCLENSTHRGDLWATVLWGHKESDTTERLTHNTHLRNERSARTSQPCPSSPNYKWRVWTTWSLKSLPALKGTQVEFTGFGTVTPYHHPHSQLPNAMHLTTEILSPKELLRQYIKVLKVWILN